MTVERSRVHLHRDQAVENEPIPRIRHRFQEIAGRSLVADFARPVGRIRHGRAAQEMALVLLKDETKKAKAEVVGRELDDVLRRWQL